MKCTRNLPNSELENKKEKVILKCVFILQQKILSKKWCQFDPAVSRLCRHAHKPTDKNVRI